MRMKVSKAFSFSFFYPVPWDNLLKLFPNLEENFYKGKYLSSKAFLVDFLILCVKSKIVDSLVNEYILVAFLSLFMWHFKEITDLTKFSNDGK